ncbi:3D domain-containing protein [Neobacillus pocheonensis]|uniref:3D domain-containing protein n=1 Tax=Neobacillus pocheonensis TaxID=363869 RepID=A0ABT0WJN8_9BACI|nr:3D domain-containing protein [Neobacillus pocheonensis]
MQQKYSQIDQQMAASQQQKAGIEAQIKAAQDALRIQQEQAQRQAAAQQAAYQAAQATQATASAQPRTPTPTVQAGSGQELYVTATAYSWQDSGAVTRLGYNIQQNPNMKLIAVDPSVIPLGKKVWVEGYGVAVAGDTGGAIVGNRIDILMPSSAAANAYGRKTVKVVILD